ncbi:P-loop containing nucleoside triphosphate hydrolase protein [Hypoxylon rubiginosum]|uniref:P-loop containing nucleoside triphosphate hydrolase protein n=1 Tax=Hypoxylon rubiginosum TaxID=110542 RepID=A0ACC0DE62_9PEZI|nr:P-loop containing nucleoside triphosphate hydrolase protein [Hypoxylon rubiginosum]
MTVLFRMIGSISRTREQTVTPVTLFILLSVIYGGFVVPPSYMVPWLGWFWRINPLSYTYESVLINELRDRSFPCSVFIPEGPAYSQVPTSDRVSAAIGSNIGDDVVQGTDYLALKYGYTLDHLWRNLGILLAMMLAFFAIHLVASQYIPAQPSRGEILLFKRGTKKIDHVQVDEEMGSETKYAHYDADAETSPAVGMHAASESNTRTRSATGSAVFYWQDVNYEINSRQGTRKILKNIDGWLKPGTLTALMGVTGAGKTTLLDVLADRVTTGVATGDISLDGKGRGASFRRRVGYVQQEDIHLSTATVREALEFSALLRQPNRESTREKVEYVNEVLRMMDMEQYADAVIGVPGEGLNVEQRRRLTIAVELAAKPDLLLFLDEPTSGLDSQTAWSICNLLRQLASSGHTILCTIHQPSSQLFSMSDRLLLLDKGGSTLFFGDLGPESSHLIQYFTKNGAPPCDPGDNPAEWILDVTGNRECDQTSLNQTCDKWPRTWQQSEEKQIVLQQLADIRRSFSQDESLINGINEASVYVSSYWKQFLVLSKRICQDQWRNPIYLTTKCSLCICLALFNGISFYNEPLNLQGLISLLFSTYLLTQIFSGMGQQVANRLAAGREIFESRECMTQSYSWAMFIGANVAVKLVS